MNHNQIQLPKGSYHAFCRQIYGVQQSQHLYHQNYYQHHRKAIPKTVQTQRPKKLDQYNTFQQYMSKLNNNNQQANSFALKDISKTVKAIGNKKSSHDQGHKKSSHDQGHKQSSHNQRRERTYQQPKTQIIEYTDRQIQRRKYTNKTQRQSKTRSYSSYNNNDLVQHRQGTRQLVGAFLPFFKTKLQKKQQLSDKQKKQFRIDNKKFRLKSLLIQQNKLVTQKWFPII